MNKVFAKTAAVLSAAVMSMCGTFGSFTSIAADTPKEVTVIFDFGFDTSTLKPGYKSDGSESNVADFASYKIKAGSNAPIPLGTFRTDTHNFSGWTVDGFYGHYSGETYFIPADYAEDTLVFKAVWYDKSDDRQTHFTYNLEYDGEPVERPTWLKDEICVPGMIYEPNFTTIKVDKFGPNEINLTSSGLTDGKNKYKIGTKFVVTEQDVEFSPIWLREISVTYFAGDVDRLNGNSTVTFTKMEAGKDELGASDRFSRSGFNLVGWTSSIDGSTYEPGETVVMPGEDVTFTAIWEPKKYNVLFKTGNGGSNKKVEGLTDTTIICPDPEHTVDGMTFAGWKDSEGDIYPVGSEYMIKGALPGSGISLTGVWVNGEAPIVTEPVVTTTATEPATTTATEPATTTETTAATSTTNPGTTEPPVTGEQPTTPAVEPTVLGDANCDGIVTMADAAAVYQHLGNFDKYALSAQGAANADVDGKAGLTAADAISIQKFNAKLIDKLPEVAEK